MGLARIPYTLMFILSNSPPNESLPFLRFYISVFLCWSLNSVLPLPSLQNTTAVLTPQSLSQHT